MKVVLVGEAWGEREDAFKHALVGPSGRELARMIAEAGLAPPLRVQHPDERAMIRHWEALRASGLAVTNVFNERPPANKVEEFFARDGNRDLPALKAGKYVKPEYMHHVIRLWDELKTLAPNLVVAMGNSPTWALLGKAAISRVRGTVQMSDRLGLKVLPTFHPAFVLREWSLRPITVADLGKASRECEFPEIRRIKRWLTCHDHRLLNGQGRMTLAEIRAWLNRPADSYAVDIETGYALFSKLELERMEPKQRFILSSLISMVSFARTPHDALVIPFMTRDDEALNYWPDPRDEVEAWRLTMRALKRPVPKTYQNGMYDISRFLEMGIVQARCERDTMLRHHALYPELPKALGFLGSLYSNEISWKTMYSDRESLKRDE